MLGNTPSFSCNYIFFTHIIQQRSLTVVNVTHYGYDWRTRLQRFWAINFIIDGFNLCFSIHEFNVEIEIAGNQLDGFSIQTLIDGNH